MRRLRTAFVLAVFMLVMATGGAFAQSQCNHAENSHIGVVQGYGLTCLGTGGGCTECISTWPVLVCYYENFWGTWYCQDWTLFQR